MAQIRLATHGDLVQLLDLISPYQSPAFNWNENAFRNEFNFSQTWVLAEADEVQAFVCLRDSIEAWEISILATKSIYLQQGLMEALLKDLIERFNRERHIWLEVHEDNLPAQKLYEKLGFRCDGRRGGYYSDGSAAKLYSLSKKS
ncbi:MAG: GNAT family N-acetyltransferase [Pseudobdellovibrionaceae bacterium]